MKPRLRLVAILGRIALLLAAFFPLAWMLSQHWREALDSLRGIDWLRLTISFLSLLLIQPWMASISWVCVRSVGTRLPTKWVFSLYFITQLPKYLPGGIWAFPGRMVAYRMVGMPDTYAILSVFREVAALFLGAVMVGGATFLWQAKLDAAFQIAIGIAIIACLLSIFLTRWPAFWKLLWASPLRKLKLFKSLFQGELEVLTSLAWLPGSLLCSILFWLATGIPFAQLIAAISPEGVVLTWFQAAALYALSWSAGFVVVLVPAGFGVRESALLLLLLPYLPPGTAASVALLSRLLWITVEALLIGISIWIVGDPRIWLRQKKAIKIQPNNTSGME